MLVGEDGRCAVGSVHVQPQSVPAANLGNRRQIIDDSGARGSGGSDNAKGLAACAHIFFDCAFKLGGIELKIVVECDAPQSPAPDAEQSRRLVE